MERVRAPALHPASLPPGTMVGPWRVLGLCSQGTYGAVYRAVRAEREDAEARAAAPDEFSPKLAQAPALVIPCIEGARDAQPYASQAALCQ